MMKHDIKMLREHFRLCVVDQVTVYHLPEFGGYIVEWVSHGVNHVLQNAMRQDRVFRNLDTVHKTLAEMGCVEFRMVVAVGQQKRLQLVGEA